MALKNQEIYQKLRMLDNDSLLEIVDSKGSPACDPAVAEMASKILEERSSYDEILRMSEYERDEQDGQSSSSQDLPVPGAPRRALVYHVPQRGGLSGLLSRGQRRALDDTLARIHASGLDVIQVLPERIDPCRSLLCLLLLVLTLCIWCPAPGYLVIARR